MNHASVEELIRDMDELGYDKIVITATKMWSYRWHFKLILDYSIDDVGQIVQETKGRVIGAASYNPFRAAAQCLWRYIRLLTQEA
jgi:hypothetical protein